MLACYLAGEVSAEIGLMHLLLGAGALPPLLGCLQKARRHATRRFPPSAATGRSNDRANIAGHAAIACLRVRRNGTRDPALWDGTSFLLSSLSRRG